MWEESYGPKLAARGARVRCTNGYRNMSSMKFHMHARLPADTTALSCLLFLLPADACLLCACHAATPTMDVHACCVARACHVIYAMLPAMLPVALAMGNVMYVMLPVATGSLLWMPCRSRPLRCSRGWLLEADGPCRTAKVGAIRKLAAHPQAGGTDLRVQAKPRVHVFSSLNAIAMRFIVQAICPLT